MSDNTNKIEEYVLMVVRGYSKDPESISCSSKLTNKTLMLTITSTCEGNAARIIGKNGNNINSIRSVARAVYATYGGKNRLNITVKENLDTE